MVCVATVVVGLVITGYVNARLGSASPRAAVSRNLSVGILAIAITWGVGTFTGGVVG